MYAAVLHQLSGRLGFLDTLFGDIDIPPAGEAVLEIPFRLAMAKQDQLGHRLSLILCFLSPSGDDKGRQE